MLRAANMVGGDGSEQPYDSPNFQALLEEHCALVEGMFEKMGLQKKSILDYYHRIMTSEYHRIRNMYMNNTCVKRSNGSQACLTEVKDMYRRFVSTTYYQTLTSDGRLHFLQDIGHDLLDKLQIAKEDRVRLPQDNPGHLEEAATVLLKCFNTLPSASSRDVNFLSRWRGTYVPKLSFMFVCIQEQRLFDQYSGDLDEFGQKQAMIGGQYGGDGGIVSAPVLITLFFLLLALCITISIATRGLGCVLLLAMAGGGRWWGRSNKEEDNAKVAKMFVSLFRDVFNNKESLRNFLTIEGKFSRVLRFVVAYFTPRIGDKRETHPDCVYVMQGIQLLESLDPEGKDARMSNMKSALQAHLAIQPSCDDQQKGGRSGKRASHASNGTWTTTGRKVRVKVRGAFLERSVYKNSATGELRVRKQSTRSDGTRKFTYVKF